MLREAFELINDDDLPAALRALQRAVAAADVPALAALSDLTRRSRGISLAELIAQTRLREATSAYHAHRGFRLRIVTPVERDALVALLQSAEGELRARRFDGRTLVDWAAAPEQYAGLTDASRSLVDDAGLLAAILAARLEHDSDLERPSPARRDAAETRVQLMRLAAGVAALPGFTDPRPPQPASAPASAASRP
ncbi:hypothetical protein RAS1_35110 [Phycisphaerae bacterium RAS1]|nr:hypothetical protein RAS1_35110 [Phycisphaerae bacterium RAS1]